MFPRQPVQGQWYLCIIHAIICVVPSDKADYPPLVPALQPAHRDPSRDTAEPRSLQEHHLFLTRPASFRGWGGRNIGSNYFFLLGLHIEKNRETHRGAESGETGCHHTPCSPEVPPPLSQALCALLVQLSPPPPVSLGLCCILSFTLSHHPPSGHHLDIFFPSFKAGADTQS